MIVFSGSQLSDHSITIEYDKIANKTAIYKVVNYSMPNAPEEPWYEIIEFQSDAIFDHYLKTHFKDSTILHIQTIKISEEH